VLFAKVVLALMLGRPAERYLDAQRRAHLQRMRELTELKRTGPVVDTLLADHGLFHLEADLRWIDTTSARLDELAEVVRSR
jgi:predicted flap endonuclease-1-like 5' DNA nuclease